MERRERKSKCCAAELLHEHIAGIRVYREVGGKKIFRLRCSKCGRDYSESR